MATLATWYDRVLGGGSRTREAGAGGDSGGRVTTAADEPGSHPYRVRAYPNEDVFLFLKRIDNSRVLRQSNPLARRAYWRIVGAACLALLLSVSVLLPRAYGVLAGYQIHGLERERDQLMIDQQTLEAEEARMLSPERLEELARIQEFVDPPPEKVFHLSTQADESVALRADGR